MRGRLGWRGVGGAGMFSGRRGGEGGGEGMDGRVDETR